MEVLSGGGGGTPGRTVQQQGSQAYMQLALYLAGNALTVFIGLLIWNLNSVLADFRDSMLYALLCSIALRPVKEWLVGTLDASLADPRRSVGSAVLSLAALPLKALTDAWEEGRGILAKWRAAVQEEFQRRQAALKRSAAGTPAGGVPTSPRTPRTAAAAAAASAARPAAAMQTMPSLAVYGHAAVKVLKSRRTSKKRRKQRAAARRPPEGGPSSLLFRWLFRCVAAWLLWEWVRDSWSTTVQVALLVFTALLALGLVPLLLLASNRLGLGATMFSPVKTPTASATHATAGTEAAKRRGHLRSLSPPSRPCFTPFAASDGRRTRHKGAGRGADDGLAAAAAGGWWGRAASAWHGVRVAAASLAASLEAGLRSGLRSNLHALVSMMLILGLFIGTTGLAAFLSVRVAQEGRNTVLAVRDVFPTAWAGIASATPLLADAAADAAATAGASGGGARALPPQLPSVALPAWVASYQQEALQLVQQSLPAVAGWAEAQFHGFVEKQNLTTALSDIRLLYEKIQGPRQCSDRERQKLTVALARADVAAAAARAAQAQAQALVEAGRAELRAAVAALDAARHSNGNGSGGSSSSSNVTGSSGSTAVGTPPLQAEPLAGERCSADDARDCLQQDEPPPDAPAGNSAAADAHGAGADVPAAGTLELEQAVVAADAALGDAKQQRKAAALASDVADREQRSAASRLQLCRGGRQSGQQSSPLPGLAGEVAAGLQRAYAKLWRRQLREGLVEMRGAAGHCAAALRGIAQRSTDAVADLSSLQRLAQAAADPLLSVGRVAGRLFAGSVGSTTAAALMGGLGVLRLGMGVVKFGMQLMLFLALLYYLLAARNDPLLAAAGVLPLSEHGRQRTAMALNRALGGVLVSSMKLIAFHGCFSWITFRVMNLPLAYTASVASAACALLPFVPTYAVALPGCIVLLAQGRLLAALLFFALHFMGYYIGDTAILEDIPGGHPYMLSLGILGGIYAFENPLQGCLLGPILLSLLSVFYNLHSEFMGAGSGSAALTPDGHPLHRLWSLTPGSAARMPGAPAQQHSPHVRMAAGEPGDGGSPGGLPMLRVSLPQRRAEGGGGGGYSPAAAPLDDSSPQHSRQRSVSLSLGRRPSARSGRAAPQASPALVAAVSAAAASAASHGAAGSGSSEEEGGDSRSASMSPSQAASIGDSFSFNALRGLDERASSKLHDD